MENFESFGLTVPEILLPAHTDIRTWSVIACDQYTQDAGYWQKAARETEGRPSTLNMILPEIYLSAADKKMRIESIKAAMRQYLDSNVFSPAQRKCMYVERKTGCGRTRRGLVAAIDLEKYDWKPFSKTLIRATEATIEERLPPRMEIRNGALLELPHIMLLVNDKERSLIEKTGEAVRQNEPDYDGDLMLNAGHITGWAIKTEEDLDRIRAALHSIKEQNTDTDGNPFLFAVGDGNHSLATAKAVWDEYKKAGGTNENVRYALAEIVNIYDPGLTFEPIHRVLFGCDPDRLISFAAEKLGGTIVQEKTEASLEEHVKNAENNFGFVYAENGKPQYVRLSTGITGLAVSRLQPALDEFMAGQKELAIDYIHGTQEVFRLGKKDGAVCILLPPIAKDSFFETIARRGPLPRKSFSMGEADEKRFYLECRRLF